MDCITCKEEMTHLEKDLFICDNCHLVSSNISPDPSIYDRSYEIKYDRYERTATGQKIQKLRHDCVKRHIPSSGRIRLLDFGCGVGSFLKVFINNNIRTDGYDINPYTNFCDISVLFKKYEVVTFWDVIEHLRYPAPIIKALNPIYLFVCTPSIDDWTNQSRNDYPWMLTEWRHYMPVEHCHYFNEQSLTSLIKSCGYKILEVNYNESGPRDGGKNKNILTVAAKKRANGTN